jgi:hypothetical protein
VKKDKSMQEENISLAEYPTIFWKKFFDRFEEINNPDLLIRDWESVHLIAYFCRRYEEYYKVKYSFRFDAKSPSKSYELFQFRKMGQMLSTDPIILKQYIDYFFETQIIQKQKRITSLAFLTNFSSINQFKFKKMGLGGNQIIERSTVLPREYLSIVNDLGYEYRTYGELSFHQKIVEGGQGDQKDQELLQKLQEKRMDLAILKKVK